MKLLFLNHNYENFGTFYRCFFLGKYLARAGHQVELVCASKKEYDLTFKTKEVEPNFKITTLPRVKIHEYHTGHSVRGVINSALVLFKDYDILHSFAVAQPATALPTMTAHYLTKKPIVVDWDDAWGGGLSDEHPSLIGKTITWLENEVPKLADKVTVASDFLRKRSEENGYKDITQIPNGANVDDIQPMDKLEARKELGIPEGEKMFIAIGHTFTKSIEIMLSSFELALKEIPDLKLYIVGKFGKQEKNIKSKIAHIEKNLVFTGEEPFARVKYYLAASDCLLLPMEDSIFEHSRSPIRLGDYMSSGRPIVSNAVGEVKLVLETYNCGLTCAPDDVEGFTRLMLKVFNDAELRDSLGKQARKIAEEVRSWQKISENLIEFYTKLLEEKK